MSNQGTDIQKVDRRHFLQLLAAGAASTAIGSTLIGCGGGSSGSAGGPAPNGATKAVSGTVNTAHIGGTNLKVQSAHQINTPVGGETGFTVQVSAESGQLLALTDEAGNLRALNCNRQDLI
jgi:hypothetical protein